MSLHVPAVGRFAQKRDQATSLLGWMAERFLAPIGFNYGSVVATDDYMQALPWPYLYTTHTEAEERLFGRVQDAIAMRAVTDDFTQGLLVLVAAHYLPTNRSKSASTLAITSIASIHLKSSDKYALSCVRWPTRFPRASARSINSPATLMTTSKIHPAASR